MNLSCTLRREESPLFRLKAPVKAVVFPCVLGAAFSVEDGLCVRGGATLPWGLAWRVSLWPWSPGQPATVSVKYPLPAFGHLRVCAEVDLPSGRARLSLRAKPRLGSFALVHQHGARPAASGELALHAHTAVPLGPCAWAQLRWELAAPADAVLSPGWPVAKPAAAAAAAAQPGTPGGGSAPFSLSHRSFHAAPGLGAGRLHAAVTPERPWLRLRLGKLSFVRMPDRAAARQGLCSFCLRSPIVREQVPAVRGGLGPAALAAVYARSRIEEGAPTLRGLRRDALADLKAVTLALWLRDSDHGAARLARHHCNYGRLGPGDELPRLSPAAAAASTPQTQTQQTPPQQEAEGAGAAALTSGGGGETPPQPPPLSPPPFEALQSSLASQLQSLEARAVDAGWFGDGNGRRRERRGAPPPPSAPFASAAATPPGGFASFDSPAEFIASYWRALGKAPGLGGSGTTGGGSLSSRLEAAGGGADAACDVFLDALSAAGAVLPPTRASKDAVAALVPVARRLLASS